MQNDPLTMGLCGETRIANKRESWVTMIQGTLPLTYHLNNQCSNIISHIILGKVSKASSVV